MGTYPGASRYILEQTGNQYNHQSHILRRSLVNLKGPFVTGRKDEYVKRSAKIHLQIQVEGVFFSISPESSGFPDQATGKENVKMIKHFCNFYTREKH